MPLASIGAAPYNASKAGLEALSATMAPNARATISLLTASGFRSSQTPVWQTSLSADAQVANEQFLGKPVMLEIDDIVHAIDFFAAPAARNITAQTLYFGGISSAKPFIASPQDVGGRMVTSWREPAAGRW